MTNTFFCKIGNRELSSDHFRPKTDQDWEGLEFSRPHHLNALGKSDKSIQPQLNDILYIWVHEVHGGRGLQAKTRIASASDVQVKVKDVELFRKPAGNTALDKVRGRNELADWLRRNATSTMFSLPSSAIEEFVSDVLEAAPKASDHTKIQREYFTSEYRRQLENTHVIEREFERRKVERRPNQSKFRQIAILSYSGECCISGCDVPESLEAAHVVPYSEGWSVRDTVGNCLLLRSDIHALFDLGKIAIVPGSNLVWLSPDIRNGHYSKYHGQAVWHCADPVNLEYQARHVMRSLQDVS